MGEGGVSRGNAEESSVTLVLDPVQFSRDAALRAAYWFSKDLNIEFPAPMGESTYTVVLAARVTVPTLDDPSPRPLGELVAEFQNALIDAELRVRVQKETSTIRELLIAKAFAEAGVLEDGPPGSFNDPVLSAHIKPDLISIASQRLTKLT
jgi:His-Xaa-Ser system protein HxsD